jgi:hypothetical protein
MRIARAIRFSIGLPSIVFADATLVAQPLPNVGRASDSSIRAVINGISAGGYIRIRITDGRRFEGVRLEMVTDSSIVNPRRPNDIYALAQIDSIWVDEGRSRWQSQR